MTVTNNQTVPEPSLRDLLDLHTKEILLSFNCHAIATVKEFDPETVTIKAEINYCRTYFQRGEDGIYQEVPKLYGLLASVPVFSLCGGVASITMPIVPGDQCFIAFNDRDIDNWVSGARSGYPNTDRMHSLSDGIAFVGLNKISDYDPDRVVIRNGETLIGLGDKIEIANTDTDLHTILSSLLTQLGNLNTLLTTAFAALAVTGSALYPGWPAGLTPITTALNQISTQIGELLES